MISSIDISQYATYIQVENEGKIVSRNGFLKDLNLSDSHSVYVLEEITESSRIGVGHLSLNTNKVGNHISNALTFKIENAFLRSLDRTLVPCMNSLAKTHFEFQKNIGIGYNLTNGEFYTDVIKKPGDQLPKSWINILIRTCIYNTFLPSLIKDQNCNISCAIIDRFNSNEIICNCSIDSICTSYYYTFDDERHELWAVYIKDKSSLSNSHSIYIEKSTGKIFKHIVQLRNKLVSLQLV